MTDFPLFKLSFPEESVRITANPRPVITTDNDLPDIKLKTQVNFPASIIGGTGLLATKANGSVTLNFAWQEFGSVSVVPTSPTNYVLTYDTLTGVYVMVPSSLLGGGGTSGIADAPIDGIMYARQSGAWVSVPTGAGSIVVEQNITGPGPVNINNATTIVRVNQTVGAPITLTMGLAANKSTPVMIVDWKGDAGTNNITINLTSPDQFPGGLTSWKIVSNTGSVVFRPIAGVGYAL